MSDLHVYDYDVDLSSDTAPARVIRMVGRGKKVLEIGAGPGSITKHLSDTNGCDVVAAEIDPVALKMLKHHARAVYEIDLNKNDWHNFLKSEGKFDIVIAADVLEHLYDPVAALRSMRALMRDDGFVILSLPHVSHCTIHACMMQEDFGYQDWGLLDRTHIRFFGLKNIEDLHASAGLAIDKAEFVVRLPHQTEFDAVWSRTPDTIKEALISNPYAYVYQCVSMARPIDQVENPISLLSQTVEIPPDNRFEITDEVAVDASTSSLRRFADAVLRKFGRW